MNTPKHIFRQIQAMTLGACLLALLFFAFFNASKHDPALASANIFIEDPFDAVGSFGIQLALLAALISFVRILRPYPNGITPEGLSRIFSGVALTLLSILATLSADGIAMLRYLPTWTAKPAAIAAGWRLAVLAAGLAVATILVGWMELRLSQSHHLLSGRRAWGKAALIYLAAWVILALYPDGWRESVPGAVITALVGMAILMALCWAAAGLVFSSAAEVSEDFLDDLLALYTWLKGRFPFMGGLSRQIETGLTEFMKVAWLRGIIDWLNPRRHVWNLVLLAALGMGIFLILAETAGEGLPQARLILLVFGVFIGIEGTGVLLGYALFRYYLGIFKDQR